MLGCEPAILSAASLIGACNPQGCEAPQDVQPRWLQDLLLHRTRVPESQRQASQTDRNNLASYGSCNLAQPSLPQPAPACPSLSQPNFVWGCSRSYRRDVAGCGAVGSARRVILWRHTERCCTLWFRGGPATRALQFIMAVLYVAWCIALSLVLCFFVSGSTASSSASPRLCSACFPSKQVWAMMRASRCSRSGKSSTPSSTENS